MGYSFASDIRTGEFYQWSEINFEPFGYFMTYDSNPPNKYMINITKFNDITYNHNLEVIIKLAYLEVNTPEIGTYSNIPEEIKT